MEQINHNTKISIMIMMIIHAYSMSIDASARAIGARIATQYVPPIIASANNSDTNSTSLAPQTTLKTYPSAQLPNKYNIIEPQQNFMLVKKNTERIKKSGALIALVDELLTQEIKLPNGDEYHIDTEFLTDKNISSFKNKFNDETDAFVTKLSDYWTLIKNKYDEFKNENNSLATLQKEINPSVVVKNKAITVNREKIIFDIKNTTEKVFDPNDKRPLSAYIAEIKQLTESLDPVADKNIIDAVDFLQKNQHRTNIIWDIPFWGDAVKTKNLKSIPYSSRIKETPKNTLLAEFNKKLNFKEEV